MSNDSEDGYTFDVSALALALAGTPVSDSALDYVREAIHGEITAVISYTSILGTYHVLRNYYRLDPDTTSNLVTNILDSHRIYWHDEISETITRSAIQIACQERIDSWDGHLVKVAQDTGATTILTLDSDFDDCSDIEAEIILSREEQEKLTEYIEEELKGER